MAGRGGKRSTTWKKGETPVKQKGMKSKKTLIKEALGLENWEGLVKYIETEGATKLVEEMGKLTGDKFAAAFRGMAEFVKPKLQHIDAKIKANLHLSDQPITFE